MWYEAVNAYHFANSNKPPARDEFAPVQKENVRIAIQSGGIPDRLPGPRIYNVEVNTRLGDTLILRVNGDPSSIVARSDFTRG
jgi:hypothetical protein